MEFEDYFPGMGFALILDQIKWPVMAAFEVE